jgi:glycosyltransferase involved in cell wall biosynthesis
LHSNTHRKKIAFLSMMEGDPWGGSEELWSRAALYLRRQQIAVRVCVRDWSPRPRQVQALADAGCAITTRSNKTAARAFRRFVPASTYRWLDTLDGHLLVLCQGANMECAGWAGECIRRKIPYIIVSQGAGVPYWPHDSTAAAMREAYTHALCSFFVSRQNLEITRRQIAFDCPRFETIWNPVNVPYDAAPPWPASDLPLKIACVARLDVRIKGHDILLDTLALPKWRERAIELSCYGVGPNEKMLAEFARAQKLANVSFVGQTNDLVAIWAAHHALVLCSRTEGLPLVVVEAMLCGRPCVVTDAGGNREVIDDNVTGFIADAPTIASFDDALERFWAKRHDLRAIGNRAATEIRRRFPTDPVGIFAKRLQTFMESPIAK